MRYFRNKHLIHTYFAVFKTQLYGNYISYKTITFKDNEQR